MSQAGRRSLRAAFRLAHRLRVETVAVDRAAALDLAEAMGLTAYDASYLWLPLRKSGASTISEVIWKITVDQCVSGNASVWTTIAGLGFP